MRRLLVLVLPAALLLGPPAAAGAKGVSDAKVCGADGCRSIAGAKDSLLQNGPPAAGPKAPEPFVRFELTVGARGHSELVEQTFLPRSGLLLFEDGVWAQPFALAEMRAAARRVMPIAASRLPGYAFAAPDAPPAGPVQPVADAGGGIDAGLIALLAATLALAAGLGVALLRRRRDGPARAAGAAG